jgi:hypothetical protein
MISTADEKLVDEHVDHESFLQSLREFYRQSSKQREN